MKNKPYITRSIKK